MIVQDLNDAELLLLFDLSNLAYRCFYGYSKMEYNGKQLQHMYGSVDSVLRSLSDTFKYDIQSLTTAVIFAVDSHDVWRKKFYSDYKANRDPNKYNPVPDVVNTLRHFPNSLLFRTDKDEADDVISYLASVKYKDKKIVIISSDSDLWQLLYLKNIRVYDPRIKEYIGKPHIYKRYGLNYAHHIPFYKSIFGDAGDNLKPVVSRVPKQMFLNLLNANPGVFKFEDFWTLLYANSDKFTKQGKLVLSHKPDVKLNYGLVKLRNIHSKLQLYKTTKARQVLPNVLAQYYITIPVERFSCCF